MARKWATNIKLFIDIGQGLAVIFSLIFISYQTKIQADALNETREVESAKFVLEISRNLDSPQYQKVAFAIEDGNNEHAQPGTARILKISGGKITLPEMDNYLGKYNDIGLLFEKGLIDEDMAYDEFSYSIEKMNCNKDIQNYIARMRKGDSSNDAYYSAIDELVEAFRARDHFTCTTIDNQ